MKYLFTFIFSFLRSGVEAKRGVESTTQNEILSEFGGKWATECLNTRFPLPTYYYVKLITIIRYFMSQTKKKTNILQASIEPTTIKYIQSLLQIDIYKFITNPHVYK